MYKADKAALRPRLGRLGLNLGLAFAWLAGSLASVAQAQEYPSRPIRVVVPFSAGGAVDGPMRVIGQEMSRRLGQQIIIDNKPGAGAMLGAEMVAKAAPDGYTLLLASGTVTISASLYTKLAFNPMEDLLPITLIGREPGVLVVHPAMPVKNYREFVAYVKERPGKIDYASSGNGSGQHLFAAKFASMAGIKMNHVPYKGSAQATNDVIAGHVQVSIPGLAAMVPHIRADKLRPLAVTGVARSPSLPDVPTMAEMGLTNYAAYVWMGLLAPKGTPAPVVDRIRREVVAALDAPDVKAYMNKASIEIIGSTPAEFNTFYREEKDRWAKVIKESGATVD